MSCCGTLLARECFEATRIGVAAVADDFGVNFKGRTSSSSSEGPSQRVSFGSLGEGLVNLPVIAVACDRSVEADDVPFLHPSEVVWFGFSGNISSRAKLYEAGLDAFLP
jgi:hypothetical protein